MSNNNSKPKAAETPAVDVKPKRQYVFHQYQESHATFDKSDVSHILKDGFDASPWHFAWIRYDKQKEAESRYFQKVTESTHKDWFDHGAFDPIHGTVGMGNEYLHPSYNGIPEVELFVREQEANQAEQEQMAAASARRLEENPEVRAIKERMGNVVGTHVFGGVATNVTGWGKS